MNNRVVFYFVLSSFIFTSTNAHNVTLKMVHVIFRHGDTDPFFPYKSDPNNNLPNLQENRRGQLTKIGQSRMYQLGFFLRQRYKNLVGDRFNPDISYVRSTSTNRNLVSAHCVISELFSLKETLINSSSTTVFDQSVPIHTQPLDSDWLKGDFCPSIIKASATIELLPEIVELRNKYKLLLDEIETCTKNMVVKNMTEAWMIYDTFVVEVSNNLPLPPCAGSLFPEPMATMAGEYYAAKYNRKVFKELQGGPILNHLLAKMLRYKMDTRRFFLYSSHATTMASLLSSMNAFNGIIPPLGSAVIFELYESLYGNYVKVLYHNETSFAVDRPTVYTMDPFKCGEICSFAKFAELSISVLPTSNWKKECNEWNDQM